MSNVVPMLFGGGKTQQSSQSQSSGLQVSQPIDYNPFAGLRDPFSTILASQMGGGVGAQAPGQFGPAPTAAMRPGEVGAMGDVNAMAMDPARRNLIESTLSGNFLPGQQGGNPFLTAAIEAAQEPTRLALEQAMQRRIPGNFAQAGHQLGAHGSSPYMRELGLAAFQGGRALGDIASNMSYQAYDSERARQQAAVQLGQSEVQQAIANFQSQQLPRLIEQAGIEGGVQQGQQTLDNWLRQMALFSQNFAPVMANFGIGTQQSTSSSTGTSETSKGIFPALFPKGMQAG